MNQYLPDKFVLPGLALLALAILAAGMVDPKLSAVGIVGVIGLLSLRYLLEHPWRLYGIYLFLLPAHIVLLTTLLVPVGLPVVVVRAFSTWKEVALAVVFGAALWRILQERNRSIFLPDLLMALYALLTLALAAMTFSETGQLAATLYGIRDHLLPMALYLVGRSLMLSEARAQQLFRWILWSAILFSLIGIFERLFIPTEWHAIFGLPRYYEEVLGISHEDYLMGLPSNFWTSSNSGFVRRAVATYGQSQPFALSFLFLLPVAIYGMLTTGLRERRLATVAFLLSSIALALTITRYTIVVCIGLLFLAGLLSSPLARRIVGGIIAAILALGVLLMIFSTNTRLLVINTLTFQDYSSSSRLVIWQATGETILARPLGYGLGSVGQTAHRFASDETYAGSIEGQFSKIGVELGLPGLILYIAIYLALLFYLFRSLSGLDGLYTRGLHFATLLTLVGLLANALTTEWHNSPSLVYPSWWLTGACVSFAAWRSRVVHGRVDAPISMTARGVAGTTEARA